MPFTSGGSRRHKAEEERITLVLSIPVRDLHFIEVGLRSGAYSLIEVQRLLDQIQTNLPKEDDGPNTD